MQVPRYKTSIALKPALYARVRHETPFSSQSEHDVWQYGTEPIAAGVEITTTEWPHPSMRPLNESAKRVLAYFNAGMRSRLPRSPWREGRVYLDDGLSGHAIGSVPGPNIPAFNTKPAA
jgi:hypothetical protein